MLKVSNLNPIIVRLKLGPTIALFDVPVRFHSIIVRFSIIVRLKLLSTVVTLSLYFISLSRNSVKRAK